MSPAVLLGVTIAACYGSLFHAVLGRRIWQWPLFCAAAVAGFFGGFAGGIATGFEFVRVGAVPLAASTLGSALLLGLAWLFSAPREA